MPDEDDPPGHGWAAEELVDAYAALSAEKREIEAKLQELKDALAEVAREQHLDRVQTPRGAMSFKRSRVLEVREKDAVVSALEKRGLLNRFVAVRGDTLFKVVEEIPALRDDLADSVEEAERVTMRFVPARG